MPVLGAVVSGPNRMCRSNTPIEYHKEYNLYVKREDLACIPPGPPFSKTRGVYSHVLGRKEKIIGVLDTTHSQAGWAVARACQILGKTCINYYPVRKHEWDDNDPRQHELRNPQIQSKKLGAKLYPLQATMSAILWNRARNLCEGEGGYMMPNALKLQESVIETAKEVPQEEFDNVLIPVSSGTLAAGVIRGFLELGIEPLFIIHLGYSRPHSKVLAYIRKQSGYAKFRATIIDEGYAYKDGAKAGIDPPWPCNHYYDLKAFRWYIRNRNSLEGTTLLWNIG